MAALVEAPRPAHHTTTIRPRAVVPIVPVIPRSLQTKRKTQPVLKPLTINDSSKDVASSSKQPVEQNGGAPLVLEGSAPVAIVNGNLETGRDGDASETVGNLGNSTLNPLEIATDCKFPTFRVSLKQCRPLLQCLHFISYRAKLTVQIRPKASSRTRCQL